MCEIFAVCCKRSTRQKQSSRQKANFPCVVAHTRRRLGTRQTWTRWCRLSRPLGFPVCQSRHSANQKICHVLQVFAVYWSCGTRQTCSLCRVPPRPGTRQSCRSSQVTVKAIFLPWASVAHAKMRDKRPMANMLFCRPLGVQSGDP